MSFIEYRFTLTSLGELRVRMLNVNMNKWAEKRAVQYEGELAVWQAAPFPSFVSHGWEEVQVLVSMSHMLHAACPAGSKGNTIYVILYAARAGREQGRDVGSKGGFSGHFKRETQHGRTTTMPAGQRFWHWISTGWAGTGRGNWIPEQAQTLHRGYPSASLSLHPSLCAAVVCVDDWFHGKVDFNQQMFMQFFACPFFYSSFFLSRLRVVVAWGFAGWQELWHYPYLERSIAALGERRSCSCLSLNCPERIIKSGEHWTYPGTLNQTQPYPTIPNRTEPKNP